MPDVIRAWWQQLLTSLRPQPQQEDVLVEIDRAANEGEAALVIALLASEDIPAITSGESVGSVYGLQLGPLAELRVLVRREHATLAEEIIDQHHAAVAHAETDEDWWQDADEDEDEEPSA